MNLWALVAVAASSAAAAWSWQANHYEAQLANLTRNHQSDLTLIGNASAGQTLRLQEHSWKLQARLRERDETHHLELTRAQDKQKRLRDRLATADLRLSVLLARPAAVGAGDVPAGTAACGVVHGTQRAELDRAHAQRIVGVTDEGDQAVIALGACQAYAKEVAAAQ